MNRLSFEYQNSAEDLMYSRLGCQIF